MTLYSSRYAKSKAKQILMASVLSLGLVAGGVTANAENKYQFVDVKKSDYYYEYIHDLANAGVMSGYDNGLYFKPNSTLTRGQMAKMFVNVIENNDVKAYQRSNKVFKDTINTSYDVYASKAYRYGIADGYGGNFTPNGIATRGQVAKLIVESFGFKKQGTHNPYKDTVNTPFADYIQILFELGITDSPNGLFHPNESVTRGQFSKLLGLSLEKWKEINKENTNNENSNNQNENSNQGSLVETAIVNLFLRDNKDFLNAYVTLTPKDSSGFTKQQLSMLNNIHIKSDVVYFPSIPVGEYKVTVKDSSGKSIGEIIQGETLVVKKGTVNNLDIVVDTSGNNSTTNPTNPNGGNGTINPTEPSKPNGGDDKESTSNLTTVNWKVVDENGNPLANLVFQIVPSSTVGLDSSTLSELRRIRTTANGEFSVKLPNDRNYTIQALNLYDDKQNQYEGFTTSNITSAQLQAVNNGVLSNTVQLKKVQKSGTIENFEDYRNEFIRLINEERNAVGLQPVQFNSLLNDTATSRSKHMVSNNYFSHYFNQEQHAKTLIGKLGYDYNDYYDVMENIANMSSVSSPVSELFNGWKNSSGHYRAMTLSEGSYIGLGYEKTTNGGYIVTFLISEKNLGVSVHPTK
ncbi:hypothetical protein ABD87_14795 [Lysinibacillus sphaericus]|uniref:CAP and S-layer homology domain-containing protein n=1 Tax=Lysinibacillus sphaericus TaxID=1421 RepID=UPI0018CEB014|nr:S-layer homology domain-containing protein [Lysinibacillus sphaericus]MBG9730765.1 hypothetical protein [Lysinibacillus sphaericus]